MRISDWSSDVCSSDLGAVNPFQTIDRKDVGLTLSVTPQISEGDTVKLKLNLEISGIASGTAGSSNLINNNHTLSNVVSIQTGKRPGERRGGNRCVTTCRSRGWPAS